MIPGLRNLLLFLLLLASCAVQAQRSYSAHSVLASGKWFQLGIPETGVYRLNAGQIVQMGFTIPLPSREIRLYGNRIQLAGEANNSDYADDLQEMAILVNDGGDGSFDAADHLLFYAKGPHPWERDTVLRTFNRRTNIYSYTAYVYLTMGGNGKRINSPLLPQTADHQLNNYQYRYHYEKDTFNLLSSGQQWFGERFLADGITSARFSIPFSSPVAGSEVHIMSQVAARAVGSSSSFAITLGGQNLFTQTVAAVSSSNLDLFARENRQGGTLILPDNAGNSLEIVYQFQSANSSAIGWLDNFSVLATCELKIVAGRQLDFRSWTGIGKGQTARYSLSASADARVWRVSNALEPVEISFVRANDSLHFNDHHEKPEEYIAFSQPMEPVLKGVVNNQDLHGEEIPEMVIITPPQLEIAANRLANWHRQHDGLSCLVVNTEEVYHEFGAGQPSPTAIRNFLKMFYDRAGADTSRSPRFLLLFGDANYDFKGKQGGRNGVPSYQSSFSLDPLSSYVSDDYFGFLDDHEDINSGLITNLLDLSIGRIPVSDLQSANHYIDKIIAYHDPAVMGEWRNELLLIADDEDNNLHLQDAEDIAGVALATNPGILQQKVYLDAFPQQSDAGGSRYPAVNQELAERMQKGVLIWNYSGHGGFRRLAEEVVLDRDIVDGWEQGGKLPLFITATCDFAPFDNPAINSLGEYLLLKPVGGAIALMTTTRLVFAFSNRIMNRNYLQAALEPQLGGHFRSLGQAVMAAKNRTYQTSGDIFNNRKFLLLGDPAMTLAFPRHQVITTHVKGKPVGSGTDTLKALQEVKVEGIISDGNGQILNGFNGTVFPQVLDRPYEIKTLGNDPGSPVQTFEVQDRSIFRGKATVINGKFSFSFLVPKDINYPVGSVRISYYAMSEAEDARGSYSNMVIAGSVIPPSDNEGPAIRIWLNDSSFRDGATVGASSLLMVSLADSSGINVLGNGIGHDISLIINNDPASEIILNRFFEADADTYKSGKLFYRLPELPEGSYSLRIKAWDLLNNSSEKTISFKVRDELLVEALGIWPNPSSGAVSFAISTNRQNGSLQAEMDIFSINGQLLKKINGTIIVSANRSYMDWNGADQQGKRLAPGIYVCRLRVRTANGKEAVAVSKLLRF
ncbi:type IX secretion system sortase PorU [Flavihumibacter sediminis]|nr:type IX secretion system sortase PorU [Flavihumibacter sediminis]